MRSASPPAGTTDRAGIAAASPAGETSGRDAVPGSAQDGETPTVDQSREWPFRDTAPRQDPAASRLDPIWGSDPPDSVRWHMDMTTDQEAPTPGRQMHRQIQRPRSLPARNGVAIAQPLYRPRPTATPAQRPHPLRRPRPMAGRDPRHSMDPVSTGPRHRWESSAARRSPQFPTRAGRRGVPSSLLEPRAPAGLRGFREGAGVTGLRGADVGSSEGPADLGPSRAEGAPASTLEPWARAGRGWVPMGLLESWARAQRRHVPASAGALDPSVAGMDSSLHAGAADPSSAWKASREPAAGDPAQPDPSGQQAASDVGWFSTVPGGGQYTGALSERLGAERPGDTQPPPTIEREPSVSAATAGSQPAVPEMDGPSEPQEPSSRERSGDAAGSLAAPEPVAGAGSAAGVAGAAATLSASRPSTTRVHRQWPNRGRGPTWRRLARS